MLTKLEVRRGYIVPRPLTWPSTKKSYDTEKLEMTGSVDGCSVLPETQFFETGLCMDTTRLLSVGATRRPMGAA